MTSSEAQAITDRLDKQDEKLDRISEQLAGQIGSFEPMQRLVERMAREIYGNSRWGLKASVRLCLAVVGVLVAVSGTIAAAMVVDVLKR